MSTELVTYTGNAPVPAWVGTIAPAAELARQIAGTEFVPRSMRNSVPQITACILYGAEIGIGPMQALAKIDIIEGKAAPAAELGRALALGAGHAIEVVEQTNTKCTVRGRRQGSDTWQTFTWTMDDAKRAGLDGKQTWRRYPRRMLLARASADLCKAVFPDCLGGIGVFAEELEGDTDAPLVAADTTGTPARRSRKLAAITEPAPPTPALHEATSTDATVQALPTSPVDLLPPLPDELDSAAPVETDTEPITDPQMRKMLATFKTIGIDERSDRLSVATQLTGRAINTAKDLTKEEASHIIDRLMAVEDGTASIVFTEDGPTIETVDDGPDVA